MLSGETPTCVLRFSDVSVVDAWCVDVGVCRP